MLAKIAKVADVPEGEARGFRVDGRTVCIANLGEAGFRAVGDLCTHAEAFLHEGEIDVDDETVECPRHGSTFNLNTGAAMSLPATAPEPTYPVKIDDDDILIEVNDE